ncbi:MAG: hypothetical protein PVF83_01545 [Anaerolineales bacterium]|jgi:hypothetical protein
MRKSTRITTALLGALAGAAGIEHGYFEILQGNTRPEGVMIASIGPPCLPDEVWNACEPAMTILPNFLITGILAVLIGLIILIWSIAFVQRKNGGLGLILLSLALLLFGGGLFPPLIGIVGGAAGTKINKPLTRKQAGGLLGFAARLWPWPLVVFALWILAQWPVGHFFNDFMQGIMGFGVILILTMMPLSIYSAYAHDVQEQLKEK